MIELNQVIKLLQDGRAVSVVDMAFFLNVPRNELNKLIRNNIKYFDLVREGGRTVLFIYKISKEGKQFLKMLNYYKNTKVRT